MLRGRAPDDVFRSARLLVDGYQSVTPLEPLELELLADLLAARLATVVTISAWRVLRYPENAEYIQAWDADTWAMIEQFDALGPDAVAQALGAPRRRSPTPAGRAPPAALGPAHHAAHLRAAGAPRPRPGAWLFEAGGRRLLDGYNNVPVVGHCHPRVTEAVVRQTPALNTHARYLYEPLVELAERLIASMPAELGLDTVMLVNSGSEANDMAWRIAPPCHRERRRPGHGLRLPRHDRPRSSDMSPEEWVRGCRPRATSSRSGR